ncbi:MAG: glycosyltransferase family 39 protein [Candidatus Peribacteraceae bacterium]|nr:glycosyltransferase family 39 protein [Candidatus Peribacteraceae bacterium]
MFRPDTRNFLENTFIFIGLLVVVLVVHVRTAPSFRSTYYRYGTGQTQTASMPLLLRSGVGDLTVDTVIMLGGFHSFIYSIEPDDCLKELLINGMPVSVTGQISDICSGTHTYKQRLNLAKYLRPGTNSIHAVIKSGGSWDRFFISVGWTDPIHLAIFVCFSLLALWYVRECIRWRKWSSHAQWMTLVMVVGLAIRLLFIGQHGYEYDMVLNQQWSQSATQLGVVRSYSEQIEKNMLPNYPPLSIYIFAAEGHLYRWLVSSSFEVFHPAHRFFVKLPSILFDLATALLLAFVIYRWKGERAARFAALAYVLHPAVIHDAVIWGQTDAWYTFFMVSALTSALSGYWMLAGALSAATLLTKMQGLALLPIMGVLWWCVGWRQKGRWAFGAAATTLIVLSPFALEGALGKVWNVYSGSIGFMNHLSENAYNFWQALYGSGAGKLDTELFLNVCTYRTLGIVLFALASAWILWSMRHVLVASVHPHAGKAHIVLIAAGLIAYAFFLFLTEMHERYLFPAMALLLPLAFEGRVGRVLYISASVLFLGNIIHPVTVSALDDGFFIEFSGANEAIATGHLFTFIAIMLSLKSFPSMTEGTTEILPWRIVRWGLTPLRWVRRFWS